MERLPNGNLLTTRYYASQHKGEEEYRVIECVQEWQNSFPVKDARKTVLEGLTREEAETTATMFDRENGDDFKGVRKAGFVYNAKLRIDFLTGNDTNRGTAENHELDFPLVF